MIHPYKTLSTDYHDTPRFSMAFCLAVAAIYERFAYQYPENEFYALEAEQWYMMATSDYKKPDIRRLAGYVYEKYPTYGVWPKSTFWRPEGEMQ